MKLDKTVRDVLGEIAGIQDIPNGAYSLRVDGSSMGVGSTPGITVTPKKDKSGIDVYIAPGLVKERLHIPVVITKPGIVETVYNDFHIGDGADVSIVAGCGIHNCGTKESRHDGVHVFHIGKNARVTYTEKHYGEGDDAGKRVMNPVTEVYLEDGAFFEMDTVQIKGVDRTVRETKAVLKEDSTLIIKEKLMTHADQTAETKYDIALNGAGCGTHIVSRSVARDRSTQTFLSEISGNSRCNGHSECDAIIMDSASVRAIPEITANHVEASLIHEAAIGKIAGEQITKLMTLGLSENEAEEKIIGGFLR